MDLNTLNNLIFDLLTYRDLCENPDQYEGYMLAVKTVNEHRLQELLKYKDEFFPGLSQMY